MAETMNAKQQTIYTLLLVLLLWSGVSNSLYGQGKLSRVRNQARQSKKEHKQEHKQEHKSEPKRDEGGRGKLSRAKSNDHDNHRHDRNRDRNRNRRHRNRRSGFAIGLNSFCAAPVQQVHVVHHPAPPVFQSVLVEQPVVVQQPVYASQSIIEQPVPEPAITVSESIGVADYFDRGNWGARLSASVGTDFDNITLGNFGLLLQAQGGLGLDTSLMLFRESGVDFRDHLYLGDLNIVYEPIVTNNFRFRCGVGLNLLGDSYGGDLGVNLTAGFDWRLSDRWTLTSEVDAGNVADADLFHAQISLGRRLSQRTDWTIGYNHYDIGGVTIGSAFTGLQFRF